jgi:hypothetical protein
MPHEGQSIDKKDLQQMQNYKEKRCGKGNLPEQTA